MGEFDSWFPMRVVPCLSNRDRLILDCRGGAVFDVGRSNVNLLNARIYRIDLIQFDISLLVNARFPWCGATSFRFSRLSKQLWFHITKSMQAIF